MLGLILLIGCQTLTVIYKPDDDALTRMSIQEAEKVLQQRPDLVKEITKEGVSVCVQMQGTRFFPFSDLKPFLSRFDDPGFHFLLVYWNDKNRACNHPFRGTYSLDKAEEGKQVVDAIAVLKENASARQPSKAVAGSGPVKDLPKIAVWDLVPRETKATYAQELTSILVSEVSKLGRYEVYSQDNVRTLAGWTAERMALGCTDTKCLTALGQMDVAKLISGSVGKIGDTYSISLNLFDTQNVKAEKSVSDFCRSENELIGLVQQGVRKLLAATR